MTDKEIIIDGIKIRGCGHYWNGTCHAYTDNTGKFLLCINSPNCYFKQLKRKEQEWEELKRELQAQRAFTTQEQRKIYCVAYDKTCETGNECKQKKCVFKDRLKYKQALGEIEEIAKHNNFLVRDPFCGTGYRDLSGQILNIINKVKN